jgi:DNA-binding PadR family transcriptional regulator
MPQLHEVGLVLRSVGGWWVGSVAAIEAKPVVDYVTRRGYVTTRVHYSPATPEGVPAYELTDAGLDALARLRGECEAEEAREARAWYREQVIQWRRNALPARCDRAIGGP